MSDSEMVMAERQPNEAETATNRNAPSPPPNCAICLGNYVNKSFSDSCMHQFCFKCLLEWSKVNAVCPLCKQPFNSIIHNVKSNNEYDEYFVTGRNNQDDDTDFGPTHFDFDLPHLLAVPRQFQFRTTLTLDPRGEFAIQQLLSTHSMNNSYYNYIPTIPSQRRRYRDTSSTNFRRWIYSQNLRVLRQRDIDRWRDVSPRIYAANPNARCRLTPWLNRELNALLPGNPEQLLFLTSEILTKLCTYHINSTYFHQFLERYLYDRTAHFIHEFYSFMRSPYDMVGYDRNIIYPNEAQTHINIDDNINEDSDSDVAFVNDIDAPMRVDPHVIEINTSSSGSSSGSDSDVIITTPPVEVVDLVDSDSDTIENPISQQPPSQLQQQQQEVVEQQRQGTVLPLKIRLKHQRKTRESKWKRRLDDSSTSSSSSSESSDDAPPRSNYRNRKWKQKSKRAKYYIVKRDRESEEEQEEEDVVDLVDSENERNEQPLMPFKIRFKHCNNHNEKMQKKRHLADSSDSNMERKMRMKNKTNRSKYYIVKNEYDDDDDEDDEEDDEDDDEQIKRRLDAKRKRKRHHTSKRKYSETITTTTATQVDITTLTTTPTKQEIDLEEDDVDVPRVSYTPPLLPSVDTLRNDLMKAPSNCGMLDMLYENHSTNNNHHSPPSSSSCSSSANNNNNNGHNNSFEMFDANIPGPSRSIIEKNLNFYRNWYTRPIFSSDDSSN